MNVLSLFDGMSCGQIALNRCGIKYSNYYASEIDKYAIKVTQANYPNTIQIGDVRHVTASQLLPINLIMAGSPCQGFSFAGKMLNFEDERSKLFFEFVRILKEVQSINPDVKFMLENVKMKKEHEQVITKILGVRPIRLNSSLVSAHNRQRLYWTNISVMSIPKDKNISLNDILETGYYSDREKSYCLDANYNKGTNFKRYFFRGSRQLVFRNGYSPIIMDEETANQVMHTDGNKWRKLTINECEQLQNVPTNYTIAAPNGERYKMLGNGWTVDIICHILKGIPADHNKSVIAIPPTAYTT